MTTLANPASLLAQMAPAARKRFGSDRRWAEACKLPAETLSRLRKRDSCDLRTLNALAEAAGYALTVVPATNGVESRIFDRAREEALLDLCASGGTDLQVWQAHGTGFFMGGLAMLLASVRGFDRRRYIELAETLHPGISQTEVFRLWLEATPIVVSRFLPLLRHRRDNEMRVHGSQADDRQPMTGGAHAA